MTAHPDCPICNARKAYRKDARARQLAAGLCPRCSNSLKKYTTCNVCRHRDSLLKRARYARNKAAA
jgi:hypothetical protein